MARKKTGPQNKGLCEFKTKFQSFTKSTIDEGTENDFICGERTLFRVMSHFKTDFIRIRTENYFTSLKNV